MMPTNERALHLICQAWVVHLVGQQGAHLVLVDVQLEVDAAEHERVLHRVRGVHLHHQLQGAAQEAVASIPHVVRPARPNRYQVPEHPAHTFSWTCSHVLVACHHVRKPVSDSLVGHLAASLEGVNVGKPGLASFIRMSVPPVQEE